MYLDSRKKCWGVGMNKTFDYLCSATSAIKGLVKKYKVGWPEQKGGWSSVFEPLVGGGSFNFLLSMGVRSTYFVTGIGIHLSANLQIKISPEKESSIQAIFEKYAVDRGLVLEYVSHLGHLNMMKQKKEKEREKSLPIRDLTYEDMKQGKLPSEEFLSSICILKEQNKLDWLTRSYNSWSDIDSDVPLSVLRQT